MDKRKSARAEAAVSRKVSRALMDAFVLEDIHSYRVNRHTFTIYVGGDPHLEGDDEDARGQEPGVEHHMADRLDMNLNILTAISRTRPILVQLASMGGNWEEGMQMFGALLVCPNPVTVMATKWARSMTSLIPLVADRFVMRPPANYMIHHGEFSYDGLAGEQLRSAVREEQAAQDLMLRIYVAKLREQGKFKTWGDARIRSMLEDIMRRNVDVWLSGDEAVEWGFVDHIYDGDLSKLRAKRVNSDRRSMMMTVLRKQASRVE